MSGQNFSPNKTGTLDLGQHFSVIIKMLLGVCRLSACGPLDRTVEGEDARALLSGPCLQVPCAVDCMRVCGLCKP